MYAYGGIQGESKLYLLFRYILLCYEVRVY